MAEVGAVYELHGDVGGAVFGLVEIDYFDYVGVAKLDGGEGFAAEAAEKCGFLCERTGDEFQGAGTSEKDVLGEIDRAHAAAAEEPLDAVFAANDCAGLEFAGVNESCAVGGTAGVVARP